MAASDQALPKAPTASLVVIGDEILSGKVQDANSAYLAKALYELGVRLCQITTVGDDDAAIGEAVRRGSAEHHWVFTCGGIGPTHDDITIAAIANAFGVKTVIHPELKHLLEGHYGARLTADHLRMAEVPAGTELIPVPALRHPQLLFGNVFIFPGVPRLFRLKFEAIRARFRHAPLRFDEILLRQVDEGSIAAILRQAQTQFAGVRIGSYPDYEARPFAIRITIEALDATSRGRAKAFLCDTLGQAGAQISPAPQSESGEG